jgi:formylglycine-generating enzyme required for sulfatase activity
MITAGNVCIDAFEVTNGAYAQFVASADVAAQPAFCSWNTDFMPKCTRLNTAPNAPVTCVDWCDAYAFCAWAGKHLCGAVDGGSLPATSVSKAGVDAWYSACSRDGTRPYPYGNVYMGVCNDLSRGAGAPVDAGSLSACTGGYDGLFDMSGNVVEWLDSCDGNTNNLDHCRFRGGAWDDDNTSGLLKCTPVNDDPRDYADDTQGFRCCSP